MDNNLFSFESIWSLTTPASYFLELTIHPKKWISIGKVNSLFTYHILKIEIGEQIWKSSSEGLLFCSFWELWAWDLREVGLVGFSSRSFCFAVIFSWFGGWFILLCGFRFLPLFPSGRAFPFYWFYSVSASVSCSNMLGGWELVFPSVSVC